MYIIIYKKCSMLQKSTVNHRNHGYPHKPMGVTIPIPIQVQCSWVQVWVDKKKPEGHLCHALGLDSDDPFAFGFLDAQHVIHGVHLLPAFAHGHTSSSLQQNYIAQSASKGEDWQFYYIGM
jgi:hypothetical protein